MWRRHPSRGWPCLSVSFPSHRRCRSPCSPCLRGAPQKSLFPFSAFSVSPWCSLAPSGAAILTPLFWGRLAHWVQRPSAAWVAGEAGAIQWRATVVRRRPAGWATPDSDRGPHTSPRTRRHRRHRRAARRTDATKSSGVILPASARLAACPTSRSCSERAIGAGAMFRAACAGCPARPGPCRFPQRQSSSGPRPHVRVSPCWPRGRDRTPEAALRRPSARRRAR